MTFSLFKNNYSQNDKGQFKREVKEVIYGAWPALPIYDIHSNVFDLKYGLCSTNDSST